jgi:hypothetical protein
MLIFREFISDKHGSEVQNYYILKFFFLTIKGMGTSTPTIKSFRPILLTVVTFFKTHCFLPIKIYFFKNLILQIKYIIKKKRTKKEGLPNHPIGGGWPPPWGWFGHPQIEPLYFFFFHRVNGVVEPPRSGGGRTTPMAQGVASHLLWGGSATPLFFFFFS